MERSKPARVRAYREPDGELVVREVEVAASFGSRLRGLLGRKSLPPEAGLLLTGVNGVHTFGMAFPIDVLFIDKCGTVVHLVSEMAPGRIARAVKSACSCLELAAGVAERCGLQPGSRVRFGV